MIPISSSGWKGFCGDVAREGAPEAIVSGSETAFTAIRSKFRAAEEANAQLPGEPMDGLPGARARVQRPGGICHKAGSAGRGRPRIHTHKQISIHKGGKMEEIATVNNYIVTNYQLSLSRSKSCAQTR